MSASGYANMGQYSWHSMPHRENYSQSPSLRSRSAPIRRGIEFYNKTAQWRNFLLDNYLLPKIKDCSKTKLISRLGKAGKQSGTSSDIPGFCNKIAYYSVNPPSTPMYLLSISKLSHEFNGFDQKSKIMINEGKIIAQHVLRLVLKSVVDKVLAYTSVTTVSIGSSVHVLTQSVALQTEHIAALNRHVNNESIGSSSSAESCMEREEKWIKDLRTLRDSHVRLILCQLRQLQDLERLGRLFTTKNLPQKVSSSRRDLETIETSI